ncbi:MAG: hypothetical protein J6B92_02775 [Paraprevotella sp.]|nr:hypothetical protein [Paraprevotella sp.]
MTNSAIERLRKADAAIKVGRIPLTTGYYRIVNAAPQFEESQGVRYVMTTSDDVPVWRSLGSTGANEAWYITVLDDSRVSILNLGNAKYIAGTNAMSDEPAGGLTIAFIDNSSSAYINYSGGGDFHAYNHYGGSGTGGNLVFWSHNNTDGGIYSTWYIEAVSAEEQARYEALLVQSKLTAEFKALLSTATEKYNMAAVYNKTNDGLITTVGQLSSNADHNALCTYQDGGGLSALIDGDVHTYFHSLWQSTEGAPDAYHNLTVDLKTTLNKFAFTMAPRYQSWMITRPTEIVLYGAVAGADTSRADSWKKLQTITGLPDSQDRLDNDEELTFISPGYLLNNDYQYLRFEVTKTNYGRTISVNGHRYPYFSMSEFQIYNVELEPNCQLVTLGEVGKAFEEAYWKALSVETPTQQDVDDLRLALQAFTEGGFIDLTVLKEALVQWPALGLVKTGTNPGCFPQEQIEEYAAAREEVSRLLKQQEILTQERIDSAIERLRKADAVIKVSRIPLTTGYYRIVNAAPQFEESQGVRYVMTTSDDVPVWRSLGSTGANEAWYITVLDGNRVSIRNLGNAKYIAGSNAMSDEPTGELTITFIDNASSAYINYSGFGDLHANNHSGGSGTGGNLVFWSHNNTDGGIYSTWYIEAVSAEEQAQYEAAILAQSKLTAEFKALLSTATEKYNMAAVYNRTNDGLITTVGQLSSNADHNALCTYQDGDGLSALIDGDVHTYFHSLWQSTEGAPDAYHNLTVDLKTTLNKFAFTMTPRKYTPGENYDTDKSDFSMQARLLDRPTEIILYGAVAGADTSRVDSWKKLQTITGLPDSQDRPDSDEELTFISPGYLLNNDYQYLRFEVTKTNYDASIWVNGHAYPFFTMSEFQIYNVELEPNCQLVTLGEIGKAFEEAYKKALSVETPTRQDIEDLRQAIYDFENTRKIDLRISNAGFATLMLPYDAALPEGVKAYSTSQAAEATANGCRVLTLVEADALQANTPYIIEGVPGTYTFSGIVTNTQDTYTNGWLTGTFVARQAQAGTYVLQNNNGITGFYRVATGKEPHVGANRVWLSVPAEEGGAAEVTAFVFGDDSATGIEGVDAADRRVDVYTLEGVCVRTDVRMSEALKALPRGVYVVSGTKKAVK